MSQRRVLKMNGKTICRRMNQLISLQGDVERLMKQFDKDLSEFTNRKILLHYHGALELFYFMEYFPEGYSRVLNFSDIVKIVTDYCSTHPKMNEDCSKLEVE